MTRLPDWRPRLSAYLVAVMRTPLDMGTHDCALFVAGAVQAMTGTDPARAWRGRYTTVQGGLKALLKDGRADHVAAVAALFDPVHPAFADLGDIAVIDVPGAIAALGIFEGQHIAVLRDTGLGFVPREAATQAFRVA